MRYGFVVPWGDAADVGDLAEAAEVAGWDGLFVWEPVWGVDAWISLGLAAARTTKIRLGTMLTPPSRRRPWELASQVATVDRLSNGRVTLSIGLGAVDSGFDTFGEECGKRERAELMDECMEVTCGLWAGQPYEFSGAHYHVKPSEFPAIGHTVQTPRVPVWCVGAIGKAKSMNRALQWDGVIPQVLDPSTDGGARQARLDEVSDLRAQIEAGPNPGAEIIVEGQWMQHSPAAYADAGATWWIESMWGAMSEHSPVAAAFDRLQEGPPS